MFVCVVHVCSKYVLLDPQITVALTHLSKKFLNVAGRRYNRSFQLITMYKESSVVLGTNYNIYSMTPMPKAQRIHKRGSGNIARVRELNALCERMPSMKSQ